MELSPNIKKKRQKRFPPTWHHASDPWLEATAPRPCANRAP